MEGVGIPAPSSSLGSVAMSQVVLIANPFASRVTEERLQAVESALARAGSVETRLTERRGHATELAAAASSADAVVVFGGDGAVNEALNGIAQDVPFGAIPGGGTSVFARALGLPRDPAAAADRVADAITAGRTRRITLGRVDGRRFGFSAGLGLGGAPRRRSRPGAGRQAARRPQVRLRARAGALREPLHARAGARGARPRPRGSSLRGELRPLHVRRCRAAARRAGSSV